MKQLFTLTTLAFFLSTASYAAEVCDPKYNDECVCEKVPVKSETGKILYYNFNYSTCVESGSNDTLKAIVVDTPRDDEDTTSDDNNDDDDKSDESNDDNDKSDESNDDDKSDDKNDDDESDDHDDKSDESNDDDKSDDKNDDDESDDKNDD